MGDRCYLALHMRKCDMPIWDDAFSHHKNPPNFMGWADQVEETDNTFYVEFDAANYGLQDELMAAAKSGAVFFGCHGPGDSYGPSVFVGVNGKYLELPADIDGHPVVSVNRHGLVSKRDILAVKRYYNQLKLAKAKLKPKKSNNENKTRD